MSLEDFKAIVELVRGRVDLAALIAETVQLTSRGSVMTGRLAPPSQQNGSKNQSLVVWPHTGTWRDFSQGFGGDCFSWLQLTQGTSFKEAVMTLAARSGVRLPDDTNEQWNEELERLMRQRKVQQIQTRAAAYYNKRLPKDIREQWFVTHYGIKPATVDELQLGWADGNLYVHLTEELGYSRDEALSTGLFVVTNAGTVEDFFDKRLVFPYWKNGRVVYFIARQTEQTPNKPWENGKYKKLLTHSEKHPYVSEFVSNEWFYNEDAVIGAEEVLITEGVTDCISARQSGVACISPVTVRFRKADVPKLLKLTEKCKRLVICNDNEENQAGEKGARETAEALWNEGRDIRIATIPRPEGRAKIDLNELIAEQGADAFKQVLASAVTWPEYLVNDIPKDCPKGDLDSKLAPILDTMATAPTITVDAVLGSISKRFGLTRKVVAQAFKDATKRHRKAVAKDLPLEDDNTPAVRINSRPTRDVIADAVHVLVPANQRLIDSRATSAEDPILFKRFGRLVQMREDGHGGLKIIDCNEHAVFGVLARVSDWVITTEDGKLRHSAPPKDVCRDVLTFPPSDIPNLDGVIYTPVFGVAGKLLSEPGLHVEDRAWMHIDASLGKLEVPQAPTEQDIERARELLLTELLGDFRFVSDADRAHMVAAIVLPFVRRLVRGPTPLHVVEAPSVGSGKSLLVNVVNILAAGRVAEMTTLSHEEEEVRKQLTAELTNAGPVLVLDNAKEGRPTASESLASALTSSTWKTRILGRSDMVELPNNATWMLTGNNVSLSPEIARRSVRIRIDPGVAKAWRRVEFRHPNLIEWTTDNRRALVTAVLTLAQAWIAAGRPRSRERLGSFEDWASVVGGILDVAGINGLLQNIDDLHAAADDESRVLEDFVMAWWEQYRTQEMYVSELSSLCSRLELLEEQIGDSTAKGRERRLGRLMGSLRDRIYGNFKIIRIGHDRKGRMLYKLLDVSEKHESLPEPDEVAVEREAPVQDAPPQHWNETDDEADPFY